MNKSKQQWNKAREGERIGSGWFVFRRHRNSKRISPPPHGKPFEHETPERAKAEAERLSKMFPGETYEVFGIVASFHEEAKAEGEAA